MKEHVFLTEAAYGKLNLTLDVVGRRADGYHDLRMVMCSVELHDDVELTLGAPDGCDCRFEASAANPATKEILRCAQNDMNRACSEHVAVPAAPKTTAPVVADAHIGHKGTLQDDGTWPMWASATTNAASECTAALPQGEGNLALRAARAYFAAAGIDPGGCFVRICKRVPMQAGMAGGSSDAAAVLRALNRHFGAFSDERLREIGLGLGSDVPYCLFGGIALAEGRGERLIRLPDLPNGAWVVLCKPDFSVSTPALFRALDELSGAPEARPGGPASNTDRMLTALRAGALPAVGAALANDFTPVLAQQAPIVEACKRQLRACGALGAELTGTGSVIFGLFDSPDTAEAAASALRASVPYVQITRIRPATTVG